MNILVVDDSKVQLHLTAKMLLQLGYKEITCCGSAEEAMAHLGSNEVHLILSDWHMTGGTGLDLLSHVRNHHFLKNTPFIMITSEHEKSCIIKAAKLGLQNYMFKPLNRDVLKNKLAELAKTHGLQPPV